MFTRRAWPRSCAGTISNPTARCWPACTRRHRALRNQKRQQQRPARKAGASGTGRLPDGSAFAVRYDAGRTEWQGTLSVPDGSGGLETFTGQAGAVFELLAVLDAAYRTWLRGTLAPA